MNLIILISIMVGKGGKKLKVDEVEGKNDQFINNKKPKTEGHSKMPGTIPGSPVLEFYNDAKIFITGGTGFLGKALIEKFLRVCPNVSHIYILIRMKKGKDPATRMKELFDDPLFNTIRKEKPDFDKKVTCIPGDVNGVRLTMSDNDYEFLTNEVTHVFHSAATVRFNEKLKTAIGINVLGTKEIIEFSNKCIRLKVLVHVSTAYAHCVRSVIYEDYYDPPLLAEKALNLVDTISDEKLESVTPEIIKPWPNTYSFTKAIAESIVREVRNIPVCIFRPGIVMGTIKEPVPGWTDNIYGPTGIIVAVGVGLLRVLYADESRIANIVPVDLTINALISCAWEAGSNFNNNTVVENSLDSGKEYEAVDKKTETVPTIYHFVVDSQNTITWGDFLKMNLHHGVKVPSERAIWYYTLTLTRIKPLYLAMIFLLHYIPGFLADGVLILLGKKPQMMKAYKKIHTFADIMVLFAISQWKFSDLNTKKLWSRLTDTDRELFDFNMARLDWDKYLAGVIIGVRNYIFNESDQTLPFARKRMFFFWLGHRIIQILFAAFCFWILSKIFTMTIGFRTHLNDQILAPTDLLRNST